MAKVKQSGSTPCTKENDMSKEKKTAAAEEVKERACELSMEELEKKSIVLPRTGVI